jgi:hypothetical protein
LSVQVSVVCAGAAGLGAALAMWRYPRADGHSAGREGALRRIPTHGGPVGGLARGLARGLAAGLLLGLVFGTAVAATLAGRSATYPEFPPGGVWRATADGRSMLVTPDGWKHARLPDGTRVAISPAAIDWAADRTDDGVLYAWTAGEPCDSPCRMFHSPVDLEVRPGRKDLLVRLPDATLVQSADLENELPSVTGEWLLRGTPGTLFRQSFGTGVLFGLTLGLVSGATAALHRRLVTPTDVTQVGTPLDVLRADRATAVSRGVLLVLFGVFGTSLVSYAADPWFLLYKADPSGSIATTSTYLLPAVAPFAVVLSAWGWFLVTRLWLCGTGRLPWRLMAFLEEAHRRGVLRQTGALYEFRHARLQERLAAWPVADRPT